MKKLELSPQNFRYDVLHLLYSVLPVIFIKFRIRNSLNKLDLLTPMDLDYVSVCQKKLTRNQKNQNNQVDDKVWLSKTKLCNGQNLPTISNDNSRYEDD